MSALLRRVEKLEQASPPLGGRVFLIGWQGGEAIDASCRGERIKREAGESVEAFKRRAIERFRPQDGVAMIWLGV